MGKDAAMLAALGAEGVVEVDAQAMRAGTGAASEGVSTGLAFEQLRGAAAGLDKPSLQARRKHQLSSLLYQYKSDLAGERLIRVVPSGGFCPLG